MPYYETVFIARQDLTDANVKTLTDELSKIITEMGGKIHKTEQWGLRSFAYRINKARKGHYVLLETDAPSDAVLEMERKMRINEDVVRYLTIRNDELSDGPSVVMDKSGDDDSRGGYKGKRDDGRNNKDTKKEAA